MVYGGKVGSQTMTPDGPIRAPELTGAIAWLNVPAPLTLKALRGKVVLLDFWTYGCINCIHILPDLKKLEAKLSRTSWSSSASTRPSSTTSKQTENIRQHHPALRDRSTRSSTTPSSGSGAPTPCAPGRHASSSTRPATSSAPPLARATTRASSRRSRRSIEVFDERGELDRAPLATAPESDGVAATALSFPARSWRAERSPLHQPTRIITGSSSLTSTATCSDTHRHRTARARATAGSTSAELRQPAGTGAGSDERLYVADTENHLLRALDLEARTVTTVAGTASRCMWQASGGAALTVALNSPWDLASSRRARSTSRWRGRTRSGCMDLARGILRPYAGIGARGARRRLDRGRGVRAAVGSGRRRRHALRRRRRVQHHSRDRAAAGRSRADARGRRPVRVRRQRRRRRRRAAPAPARAWRIDAGRVRHRRHLQPQDQTARSGIADASRPSPARGTPGSETARGEGAVLRARRRQRRAATTSTSPTRTTTPSAPSTREAAW